MKNKLINDLFGKELVQAMKELLNDFIANKYNEKEIEKALKDINESVRVGLYLMALEKDNNDLAYKINLANKIINIERKEKFIKAYQKGEAVKYLSILGKGDKISLMTDLGVDVDVRGRAKLSSVERDYYTIISNSIMEDQKFDLRDGIKQFTSKPEE